MLDLVPFAGSRGIMTDRDIQPRLVGPPLQLHLPQANAVAIAAPAIRTHQYLLRLGIQGLPHLAPPAANALHRKARRVMRAAHRDPPQVVLGIIDTTRDRLGNVRIGKVMHLDLLRLPFRLPFLPGIGVVSDLFLLLGIDRYDGPVLSQESFALALDVAKLGISIGMLLPFMS